MVSCEQIWANVSAYLDQELASDFRASFEEHVGGCRKCTAVVDGVRNVVGLYGDERFIQAPEGYSRRLRQRLADTTQPRPSLLWGWLAPAAAVAMLIVVFLLGQSTVVHSPVLRSQLAQPGIHVPPQLQVVVEPNAKLFHVASCPAIHDRQHLRIMTSEEALHEGYTPCPRCLKEYLKLAGIRVPRFGAPTVGDLGITLSPE